MKNIYIVLSIIFIWLTACTSKQNDNTTSHSDSLELQEEKYELVWSDEFNYQGLPDSTKWSYDVGGDGWGNNELQYYTDSRSENARVENGYLIIEARKENIEDNEFTSARLVSKNKGDWKYAKIVVRAKLPGGVGLWPAIWMLPAKWDVGDGEWPDCGEIDIMEYVGYAKDTIHGTIHCHAYNHLKNTQKGKNVFVPGVENDFHDYTLIWNKDKINIMVNDSSYFEFEKQEQNWKTWPFYRKFYLILNIAVGGNWGGRKGVDDSIFPQTMEVDYVRVYQKK